MGNTEIPGHHAWQLKAYLLALKIPGGLKMFSASLGWRWMRRSPLGFGGCFTDAAYADAAHVANADCRNRQPLQPQTPTTAE